MVFCVFLKGDSFLVVPMDGFFGFYRGLGMPMVSRQEKNPSGRLLDILVAGVLR